MTKFKTRIFPYDRLKPGDLLQVLGGFMRFRSSERLEGGYVRVKVQGDAGEIHHVTHHGSNWPMVAVGFTTEYRAAYPDHEFNPTEVMS